METLAYKPQLSQIEHCLNHYCESIHDCLVTLECNCPHILCDHEDFNEDLEFVVPQATNGCDHDHGISGDNLTLDTSFLITTIESCKHCPKCQSHVSNGYCDTCQIYLGFN